MSFLGSRKQTRVIGRDPRSHHSFVEDSDRAWGVCINCGDRRPIHEAMAYNFSLGVGHILSTVSTLAPDCPGHTDENEGP